jgi:hypothetical protein
MLPESPVSRSVRRPLRVLLVLALAAPGLATSCVSSRGISLLPGGEEPEAMAEQALALVTRIAERHRLAPAASQEEERLGEAWNCWIDERRGLCAKRTDAEVQFRISNVGRGIAPQTDSLRKEVGDSLRARYGPDRIRSCEWRRERDMSRAAPATRSVCAS